MRTNNRRVSWLIAVIAVLGLVAAACGSDEDSSSSGDGGSSDLSGSVVISGSSTVEPISSAVAETFQEENSGVEISVDGPGTGDGFEKFCAGETDISDASRPIKEEEAAACEEAGIEFIELKVAFDGLSVITHPDTEIDCLTFEDLYALVGPESQGFDNWSDAQALATELGSSTELPDLDLSITAPGEESGTYDSFVELVLTDIAEARVEAGVITEDEAGATRADYQGSANDNVILEGVEGTEGSLGWVGLAFAEEAGDQVKIIDIDAGDGCVAAESDSVADGSYPISRSLYIYVKAESAEREEVAAYVDYYLNDGISAVEEVGYVTLPDDQLDVTRTTWEDRTTGSTEG